MTFAYTRPVPPIKTVTAGDSYLMSFNYGKHPAVIAGEKLIAATVTAIRPDGLALTADDISFGSPSVAIQGTLLPDGSLAGDRDSILVPFTIPVSTPNGLVYGVKCLATTNAGTTPPHALGLLGRLGIHEAPTTP